MSCGPADVQVPNPRNPASTTHGRSPAAGTERFTSRVAARTLTLSGDMKNLNLGDQSLRVTTNAQLRSGPASLITVPADADRRLLPAVVALLLAVVGGQVLAGNDTSAHDGAG